ncbi:MAG: hypothetical protein IH945_09590 [Armatimonadetes bacterium]|nr:hypothetical protein [Armatimonadota bacterium]
MTGDADDLTNILVRAATELYSITDEDPMDLQFEEHEDERDQYRGDIVMHTLYPMTGPDEPTT